MSNEMALSIFALINIIYCMYMWFGGKKALLDYISKIKEKVKEVGLSKYLFEKLKDFTLTSSAIGIIFAFLSIGILIDGIRYGRSFDIIFSLSIITLEVILVVASMMFLGDIKIKHKKGESK